MDASKPEFTAPPFVPTPAQEALIKLVFEDLKDMQKARDRKYRLLGDRSPQRYWDEQEKRFTTYIPPKDVTEDDWQANVVMGLTRNAVLSQVSKTGMRVPEVHFKTFGEDGYVDDVRSRIYDNAYKWANVRINADLIQQYVSIGTFVRGNSCVYLGFEEKQIDVELVTDVDERGKAVTKKQVEERWGPTRQIVPLNEILFPNYFANDIQEQPKVIWKQTVPYATAKAEFGHLPNWKYVVPGKYTVGVVNDPFFYSRSQLHGKHVDIVRHYGNPWAGGDDRLIVMVQNVPMYDMPLPFNHKRLPFAWGKNSLFTDKFMLGMGVPFMMMDAQDIADANWNMALDKNTLSMQKPIMTDDPDPTVRTYLSPGAIMQFTRGSTWQTAPIEGVTSGEFNLLQESMRQAKEFSTAFGGAMSQTARGGKITAKQAAMIEEETKRLLGIPMSNLESLERDAAIQIINNFIQFATGSGRSIDIGDAKIHDGRRGRFVAFFSESLKKAQALETDALRTLSAIELAGEQAGQPTEAVAIAPDWFDLCDRIEASAIGESAYNASKSLEQAMASEDYAMLRPDPLIDGEELLRITLKKKGLDPDKLITKQAPQAQDQQQQGQQQGQQPGGQGPPQPGVGPLAAQLSGSAQPKSLSAMTG